MNVSSPFIQRPVATSLLMLAILLVGIVAYRVLPLSALPKFDYPTIQVVTLYPGASPELATSAITAPLARQFGQMPGLNQAVLDWPYVEGLRLDEAMHGGFLGTGMGGGNTTDAATACLNRTIRQALQHWPLFRTQHAPMKAAHDHCP